MLILDENVLFNFHVVRKIPELGQYLQSTFEFHVSKRIIRFETQFVSLTSQYETGKQHTFAKHSGACVQGNKTFVNYCQHDSRTMFAGAKMAIQ